jgi:hypothetical protein
VPCDGPTETQDARRDVRAAVPEMMPAATRELDEVAKCVGRFWETNAEPLTRVPSPSDGAHSLRRRGMSPPATPRADAALASVAGVGPGDPPASAGDTWGDRGGGDAPSASGVSAPAESPETARGDVAFHGGERSPPPRDPADESFEAGGGGLEDADASPSAKGREEDVLDDGEGDGDGRADAPSSPRRVRTPDLKLRRPKPKQSAYHVVIKPRTPSPEPPTPVPSNPSTPAPSESDSESEDDTPPSPPPPPPKPADARLRGKKLRLTVLGVRNAPVGLGDVFCVVECGTSVLETTQPAPPPNAAPVQTAASSFEIFFDAPGASGDVAVIAFGEKGTPRLNDDDANAAVSDLYHPIELARVTLSAYDFLPDGDLDDAFVERLGVVDVGDWVPMRRPRGLEKVVKKKFAGASVPVATTSARLVARLVDADHVESWEAERALAEAVARATRSRGDGGRRRRAGGVRRSGERVRRKNVARESRQSLDAYEYKKANYGLYGSGNKRRGGVLRARVPRRAVHGVSVHRGGRRCASHGSGARVRASDPGGTGERAAFPGARRDAVGFVPGRRLCGRLLAKKKGSTGLHRRARRRSFQQRARLDSHARAGLCRRRERAGR